MKGNRESKWECFLCFNIEIRVIAVPLLMMMHRFSVSVNYCETTSSSFCINSVVCCIFIFLILVKRVWKSWDCRYFELEKHRLEHRNYSRIFIRFGHCCIGTGFDDLSILSWGAYMQSTERVYCLHGKSLQAPPYFLYCVIWERSLAN